MDETRVPGEKPWPAASHQQILYRNQASTLTYFSICTFGQQTKKSTCLTKSFSCPKKLRKITKTRE